MARFAGTIRRSDLEGGVVQLAASDGQVYELENQDRTPIAASWIDKDVVVVGTIDKQAMSFTMTGPRLIVTSIKNG